MVKVRERTRAMRDAARFRRARHRKQINPKTCAHQCPKTFRLTVDPPPSLRRFASRASAAFARLSTASSLSTPASVATVPPWRYVPRPPATEKPPISPFLVAHCWDGSKRGTPQSSSSVAGERFAHLALLLFFSPTGAWMVRPYQKAVEPERPRHQGVAGEGRAAHGHCGRASQEVPHHREVNRVDGCFGGDGRRGTGTTYRREVSRGLRSGWISRTRGV